MEDYFRTLIEKCKDGELSANDILDRVAKSNFATPTNASISETAKRVKQSISYKPPVPQEKPVYRAPTSLLSASTKPTEILDTQSDYENPSIAQGLEDREEEVDEVVEDVESDPVVETYNSIFEKQMKKRQELWQKYQDRELQNYIEEQLTTIFDNIRSVKSREQLDDIKRKCRLKWFLRMKKLRDSRKVKDEDEFRENCSFQPRINDSNAKPRYMEIQTRPDFGSSVSRECTFTPDLSNKNSKSIKSLGNIGNSRRDTLMCMENSVSPSKTSLGVQKERNGSRVLQGKIESDIEAENSKQRKIYVDDDFNDLMGSLNSVQTYDKDISPRMHIRDLQSSQADNMRVEKTLSFTDCKKKEMESRKQSIVAKSQAFLDKHGLKLSGSTKSCKQPADPFLYTRLAEPRAKSTKAVPKESGFIHGAWNSKTVNTGVFKNNYKKPALGLVKTPSKVNLEESVNRQQRLNERKEEKLGQLEKENKEKHPFRPQVSEESEMLDRQMSEKFTHRENRLNERKDKKMSQLDKENLERHPFKPQVSKTAQTMDRKVYEDKVANFIKNREEKLAKLREESARKEMEGVTLQPKINKAVPASSKLGINLATKDYINYIREKEEVDRQFVELAKKRKEAIEAIECTHTPQISVKPCSSKAELSSPKISLQASSRSSNYRDLHEKKKPPVASTGKLTTWNFLPKEEMYIPSLFDEGYNHEISFDQHEESYKNSFH